MKRLVALFSILSLFCLGACNNSLQGENSKVINEESLSSTEESEESSSGAEESVSGNKFFSENKIFIMEDSYVLLEFDTAGIFVQKICNDKWEPVRESSTTYSYTETTSDCWEVTLYLSDGRQNNLQYFPKEDKIQYKDQIYVHFDGTFPRPISWKKQTDGFFQGEFDGVFSNSATRGSTMSAEISILTGSDNTTTVAFRLFEYGSSTVTLSSSDWAGIDIFDKNGNYVFIGGLKYNQGFFIEDYQISGDKNIYSCIKNHEEVTIKITVGGKYRSVESIYVFTVNNAGLE